MRYVFVDRITSLEPGDRLVAFKNVAYSDGLARPTACGGAALPSATVVECLAQAAGLLAVATIDFAAQPVLAKLGPFSLSGWARPGDRLALAVELEELRDEGCRARAWASVDDDSVAEGTIFLGFVRLEGELEARRVEVQRRHLACLFPEWFAPEAGAEAHV